MSCRTICICQNIFHDIPLEMLQSVHGFINLHWCRLFLEMLLTILSSLYCLYNPLNCSLQTAIDVLDQRIEVTIFACNHTQTSTSTKKIACNEFVGDWSCLVHTRS